MVVMICQYNDSPVLAAVACIPFKMQLKRQKRCKRFEKKKVKRRERRENGGKLNGWMNTQSRSVI